MCGYVTVFQDDEQYRMYYKAWNGEIADGKLIDTHGMQIAYAESTDGKRWTRPELSPTDVGGSMCHAAIICREYALPTVVGTGRATSFIKTGDMIRIDGDSGVVKILERA